MNEKSIKKITTFLMCGLILVFTLSVANVNNKAIETSTTAALSDKKIGWGYVPNIAPSYFFVNSISDVF